MGGILIRCGCTKLHHRGIDGEKLALHVTAGGKRVPFLLAPDGRVLYAVSQQTAKSPMRAPQKRQKTQQDSDSASAEKTIATALAPMAAVAAFLAAIIGLITNWQKLGEFYESSPISVGAFTASAAGLISWVMIGKLGSNITSKRLLAVRLSSIAIVIVLYSLLVLWPNRCTLSNVCAPSDWEPFQLGSLVTPASAEEKEGLEILSMKVDVTRSSFILTRNAESIHGGFEEVERLALQFDRDMHHVFSAASCRGIGGERPIVDALPVWRSLLIERGRRDLANLLVDYKGYQSLLLHSGREAFIEARPTAAELATLMATKPELFSLLMRWMVECVGVAEPVLIWTLRNNTSRVLTLLNVDYIVLDVGQVKGAGPDTLDPIDVMPHELYHQTGVQERDINPHILLSPGDTVTIRIRYRLETTDWGFTWLIRPIFHTAEGVSSEGPEFKIFNAKRRLGSLEGGAQ